MALLLALAVYRYHQQQQLDADDKDRDKDATAFSGSIRQSSTATDSTATTLYSTYSTADTTATDSATMHTKEANQEIRAEWINAVFGPDILQNGQPPPRQGVGLAQVPWYVSYQCTIPPAQGGDKVGVTIARIALGLYVKAVAKNSAAGFAGVLPDSVLVSINGMGMLGEPFKQGWERLKQYEMEGTPVKLVFIKNGTLYHVLILSKPPFGISWASCGDFALVQRSYSHAAQAGVLRGCLVAAVNGKSLRTMDHEDAAARLRELFIANETISISLVYTPAASRTVYYDTMHERISPLKPDARAQLTEYSMAKMFICGSTTTGSEPPSQRLERGGAASNLLNDASSLSPRYSPCPALEEWLTSWNLIEALVFLLQASKSGYDEDILSDNITKSRQSTALATLQNMMEEEDAWKLANKFLLQWVSILCNSDETDDKELASILLTLSRRDEAFCQRLYFLLRSYTATLEGHRSKQVDNSRNLLTLLQALDRLRYAQKQLTSQLTSSVVEVATPTSEAESVSATTSTSTNPSPETAPQPKKSKKFRMFRKKDKMRKQDISLAMVQEPSKSASLKKLTIEMEYISVPFLLENMTRFLTDLDGICDDIERSLLKSFSQKIADWALQPWSASKGTALAKVAAGMRSGLLRATDDGLPLVNPLDASEVFVSLRESECFILPSAHFPLLLTFDVKNNESASPKAMKGEQVYRTRVEIIALRGGPSSIAGNRAYTVQAAVGGVIEESGKSSGVESHGWDAGTLTFETRSSWGAPKTLSLRLSSVELDQQGQEQLLHTDQNGKLYYSAEEGYCWVDMSPMWKEGNSTTVSFSSQIWSLETTEAFDQHGYLMEGLSLVPERLELDLRITTEVVAFSDSLCRSRTLLYKHDDDVRQEMFAIQFIDTCDLLLKASGLDLKLLTFRCIAVGAKRGFIEWVPGSVPLSDICQPDSIPARRVIDDDGADKLVRQGTISQVAKAGLVKYQSLYQAESVRKKGRHNSLANNPIQDFLRSVAYNEDAPYLIRREVMDTYVKSCAGYCVLTYLLGVGDRHLDNLLLHHSGNFFHCDYSFILGNDPKTYLPMRITEDMVNGMGGRDSDNYAKFLSMAGASFVTLRHHANARVILSLIRLMVPSALPDVSVNQNADLVVSAVRDRLHLDLSDDKAIAYIEGLIENSIASKMWLAVDVIHRLGKRF